MADIVLAQTGDWNVSSTWIGGVVPGNGDNVILADGYTVTIPSGYTAIVGTSPADNSGAVALRGTTDNGTGRLVVNGTLVWRGPVRQPNATWTINAGGTLTYDATLAANPATALYKWVIAMNSLQANAKLVFAGTFGSHVTVNAASNIPSGNYGIGSVNWSDGGRIEATFADISYQGTSSVDFLSSRPNTVAASVFFDNCTIDHCGQINMLSLGGESTFRIKNTVIKNPSNTSYTVQAVGTTTKTTGQRLIQNSSIVGKIYVLATGGVNTGFELKNFISKNAAGPQFSNGGTATLWDSVLLALINDGATDLSATVPSGSLTNSYVYRQGNPSIANTHPIYLNTTGANTLFDSWIWDYTGSDINSDMIELTGVDASSVRTLTISHNVFLPNAAGEAAGTYFNNSSLQAQSNTKLIFDNNTAVASGSTISTSVHGLGAEGVGTTWPVGAVQSARNNLLWRPSSSTGVLFNSTSNATISDGAVVVSDYNNTHNITGSIYGMAGAKYAESPGGHDLSLDPQFTAPDRNMLSFDQGYMHQPVATAWVTSTSYLVGDVISVGSAGFYSGAVYNYRCTSAHTSSTTTKPGTGSGWSTKWEPASLKYIEDSVLAEESFDGNSIIYELVKWVKSGFAPTTTALSTAGFDGGYIGAVDVYAPPPPPSGGGHRRAFGFGNSGFFGF